MNVYLTVIVSNKTMATIGVNPKRRFVLHLQENMCDKI
jgi:hypothetical protein